MSRMNTSQQPTEVWEGNVYQLLWHIRYEDPTQYHALVKMHLSFATDLPVDECDGRALKPSSSGRKWQLTPLIRRLGRTSVSLTKGVMEGAPLTQEGVCQAFQLIHFLNKEHNISQEGLFRKSGSLTRQQELKNLLNSGRDLNLDSGSHSAHDCASVLKSFLADLPEPLLTEAHYPIHCKIAEMLQSHMCQVQKDSVQIRQVKALRLLFLLLPPENYQLLQDLLILLHRVAENHIQNLMTASNLGTMFSPHILCPRKMTANDLQYLSGTLSTAVAFMIENASQLFQIPLELEYDIRQYWNNKKKLTHQLSKRSLMDAPTNTIFTFIDRELTAQANDKDVTEMALAELYAYVQSLPDSAKKRKLIKKFNHASGLGTPQLNHSNVSKKQEAHGRKLGESIKKHLFYKTVKSSKTKSTPISSYISSAGVKRTKSEDLLCSPSKRSPELRRFQRNSEESSCNQLRTKSLDDLSSHVGEYSSPTASINNHSTCSSIIHPAYNPKAAFHHRLTRPVPISVPQRHNSESSSMSYSESSCTLASPLPFTPLPVNTTTESQNISRCSEYEESGHSILESTARCDSSSINFTFQNSILNETKDNTAPESTLLHSIPAGSSRIEVHSPISEAMLRSSIPQKVIMTPRSRCPIIVNSTTNLTNTAIPEENDTYSCSTILEVNHEDVSHSNQCSPIISNPLAMLCSPKQSSKSVIDDPSVMVNGLSVKEDCNNQSISKLSKYKEKIDRLEPDGNDIKPIKWRKSSLRRTLSSASSTGSLFGSFFHHLSTSSLGQLATKLTSSAISSPSEEEEEEKDIFPQESSEKEMNESLSSVFREYLLSRSILTDNPVDLSTEILDCEENVTEKEEYSSVKEIKKQLPASRNDKCTHPTSQSSSLSVSQLCSTPAAISVDSAVQISLNNSLSDSLIFCLDGNNPMSSSVNTGEERNCKYTRNLETSFQGDNSSIVGLHSSAHENRRQSILKTKQGTPVPQWDKEAGNSLAGSTGVLFETSF